MLRIAICDNEQHFNLQIKKCVEEYLKSKIIEYEIDVYNLDDKIFNRMNIEKYSIIFLDISESDSVVMAQQIRIFNPKTFIVVVTNDIKFLLEGYKVNAIRGILKNSDSFINDMFECMETVCEKMDCNVQKKIFKFHENKKNVVLDELLYIESKGHILRFYIKQNKLEIYTMRGTLKELENELTQLGFLRVHQSYLVNLKHVKKIKYHKIILDNDKEITVPKLRYRDVKDSFIAYKRDM